ncbi:MAG: hypothetical protein ACLR8U_15720 [Oscillospiraceae bacterium]
MCEESITVGDARAAASTKAGGKLLAPDPAVRHLPRPRHCPRQEEASPSRLELRADDRTLTDEDSTGVVEKVLAALKEEKNVTLR